MPGLDEAGLGIQYDRPPENQFPSVLSLLSKPLIFAPDIQGVIPDAGVFVAIIELPTAIVIQVSPTAVPHRGHPPNG